MLLKLIFCISVLAEAAVLFDLQNDPGESTSRAQDPAQAATVSELKARLGVYRR